MQIRMQTAIISSPTLAPTAITTISVVVKPEDAVEMAAGDDDGAVCIQVICKRFLFCARMYS